MLSNYVTPQLLPTLTRVGMNHQDKKLCMMPVSLGQLRAWAGCSSRMRRAGHDTSIPQPKLQDTQDEPVLLQPTHQLTSGLEGDRPHVQRYRTQQTGEAWEWCRSLTPTNGYLRDAASKILHREHITSPGTAGSCSHSVCLQPELCLHQVPTQSRAHGAG